MKIGIRGGGHNWCAAALQEGGILLDLSRLNQVEIDPEARAATAEPVVTSRFLAKELAKHGLAFPVGHCPCVPLSGFILSGGLGWNAGEWGISCFSLLSVDVVTADGSLVTASETENTELLWAARGAGPGFFGVATKYRVRLYRGTLRLSDLPPGGLRDEGRTCQKLPFRWSHRATWRATPFGMKRDRMRPTLGGFAP